MSILIPYHSWYSDTRPFLSFLRFEGIIFKDKVPVTLENLEKVFE